MECREESGLISYLTMGRTSGEIEMKIINYP